MSVLFEKCLSGPWKTVGADVQYYIEGDMLVFQHTVSKMDWIHNFTAIPVEAAFGATVHAGFYAMLLGASEILDPFKLGIKLVTGFSQGGGLAQLYSAWFGIPCVTFGAPKVFYQSKKQYPQIVNYVRRGDIVSWIPFRFKHGGQVRKIGPIDFPGPWQHMPSAYRKELEAL